MDGYGGRGQCDGGDQNERKATRRGTGGDIEKIIGNKNGGGGD